MFMHEAAMRLLRHLKSSKGLTVDELAGCIDWLIPWLGFERDILATHKVDLKWIQLLAHELGKQWLL